MKQLRVREDGVVYAEFLMAFTPFFLLFLGIIQTAFIATGAIVVQTAASKAARAAMVVLPDDPFFYKQEKALLLDFKGQSDNSGYQQGLANNLGGSGISMPKQSASDQNLTSGFSGAGGGGGSGSGSKSGQSAGSGGPRLNAIRLAAYLTLAPLGPNPELFAAWVGGGFGLSGIAGLSQFADQVPGMPDLGGAKKKNPFSLKLTAIGKSPLLRFAIGFGAYNAVAAAVNFPVAAFKPELRNGGEKFSGQVTYKPGEKVTVRVTYLFPCGVPLANMIICKQLSSEEDSVMDELKAGVQNSSLLDVLALAQDARFYVLRREATLPIQSAAYCYPTDKECKP